jgi:xylan 1,4-beta-xylosidase
MVDAIATRDDGRIAIVLWNGTVDVTKSGGDAMLDRELVLTATGLPAHEYRVRHRRLDHEHSDLNATWLRVGGGAEWPDADQWRALLDDDRLVELEPVTSLHPQAGELTLTFPMPMPSVSLIELVPA